MIRRPEENERAFVRNMTEASVTFAPSSTLVVKRGGGVWVDEHWTSFDSFRDDSAVMALSSRSRIRVDYITDEVT